MSLIKNFFSPGRLTKPVDLSILKTDMHSHLIPKVDDGSDSLETSVGLIKGMTELGYSRIITTPHIQGEFYKNSAATILPGLEQLKRELAKQHVSVQIEAAAEYLIDEKFGEKIKNRDLLTFSNNYLLVEMSFFNEYPHWKDYFFELQIAGYKIILAHPERYSYFFRNWNKYEEIKDRGVLFQLNIVSLAGYYSAEVKRIAEKLIENNMIDLVGTDMHNFNYLEALKKACYERSFKDLVDSGRLMNASL
ncbi:MAG TPA: capsular biosynthesis protein [Bacteroidales bacterium]|nr:capsular biosynthesis protein [Bacteroidales bacterium]